VVVEGQRIQPAVNDRADPLTGLEQPRFQIADGVGCVEAVGLQIGLDAVPIGEGN
jgi:hypothetical protein